MLPRDPIPDKHVRSSFTAAIQLVHRDMRVGMGAPLLWPLTYLLDDRVVMRDAHKSAMLTWCSMLDPFEVV
jgi:hypothetical protein